METLPVVFEKKDELMGLVDMADKGLIAPPAITEPSQYIMAGEMLKGVKGLYKKIEAYRKTILAPIDAQRDAVQAWFKPYLNKCLGNEAEIKRSMLAYDAEQERLRKEQEAAARKLAEEIAEKQRAELRERQAEAVFDGDTFEAELAGKLADNVEVPLMCVPEAVIPVNGVGKRTTWKARVVDFAKLPDRFKQPNEREIARYAQLSKGETLVPGLEFYSEAGISSRSI